MTALAKARRVSGRLLCAALVLGAVGTGCAAGRDLGGVRVAEGPKARSFAPEVVADRSAASVGVVITDQGRGMGFVIDSAGYMITNRHVVEDADHIEKVQFPGLDGVPEYSMVEVVYIDPQRDLALLHIDTDETLPALGLATRKRTPVSDYVGEREGVVILSREVDPDDAATMDEDPGLLAHTGAVERLEVYNPNVGPGSFVGVTARIQQGQSGGPVLDHHGRVIGVVTWTWRDQKGGFAIPIAEAVRMLDERPELESELDQRARAESRALEYLAALGTGSVDELARLTSPSHAREIRGRTIDVLIERSSERSVLQGFLAAIDELVADRMVSEPPLATLESMVAHTGSDEVMRRLGVSGTISRDAVQAFFYEIGSTYMAARWFGNYGQREALLVAVQHVYSLDTARSMALVDIVERLAGVRSNIERIDVSPSLGAPKAVITADIGKGGRIAVQMRMEWGDWYVSEVQFIDDAAREASSGTTGSSKPTGSRRGGITPMQ